MEWRLQYKRWPRSFQTDAIELASLAAGAWIRGGRRRKLRLYRQSIDFFFQDTEWLSDEEASGGLELHEEFVRKLVAFLDGGARLERAAAPRASPGRGSGLIVLGGGKHDVEPS